MNTRKRLERAVPSPEPSLGPLGCVPLLVAVLSLSTMAWSSGWRWVPGLTGVACVLILAGLVHEGWQERRFLRRVAGAWAEQGVDCLVVLSESPNWAPWIRERWLPVLTTRARVLNYSERSTWPRDDMAVRLFRRFCGSEDFNPAIVVLRGAERPLVYRFYRAFRELKAGRAEYVHRQEKAAFEALGLWDEFQRTVG